MNDKKIIFEKSYARDTTLFMQVLWAKGLKEEIPERFGWNNPYLPFVAHFVNDGVVEIWEHKTAIKWMLDRILEENQKGTKFLNDLFKDYIKLLAELKEVHEKEYLRDSKDIHDYSDLIYKAALYMTTFFYVGSDERSPKEAQDTAVQARKEGDFFADNDVFVRKNIAKLGNITEELAGVVLPNELESMPHTDVLEKRLEAYLLIDGQESFVGSLEEYIKAHDEYIFQSEKISKDISELKGSSACKGVVRGLARIVLKQSHMSSVKKGDILVAPMTTPDFLPAMERAGAFVTDEGGITCHAAIVAREMNKPCIIGTKIATEVLKDGDMVEVDADNGVVRIVK
jgi:phosphoenolpyruvate synthase/pyruvate phosphate dikinase